MLLAYQGAGGVLLYLAGTNTGSRIVWQNPVPYATGYNPSISIMGGSVAEVHQADSGTGPLLDLNGSVSAGIIQWKASPTQYANGCYPSVAIGSYLCTLGCNRGSARAIRRLSLRIVLS